MKQKPIGISELIFYISFVIEALAFLLLLSNNYLSLESTLPYILILLVINAPILIGFSIYRITKREYIFPIIGILLSVIVIILFVSLLYALSNFT